MEVNIGIRENNFIHFERNKSNNLKKSIFQKYNLNKVGTIEFAKIHQSANRPLYKKSDFNDSTIFCKCCNLPAEQKGVLEKFSFCDDPDKFIDCGEGVTLYFIFFKFSIIVLLITFFLVCLCNIIFSKIYYEEVYDICNNKNKINKIEDDCKFYLEISEDNSKSFLISNSFFFKFNGINAKYYRNLYLKLITNNKIEKNIVNTSFLNFLCLITLFILNLIFIIFIYSKSQNINLNILSLSDYSIFITNMKELHQNFLIKKNEIEQKKLEAEKNNEEYNYEEEMNNLGIISLEKPITELSEWGKFVSFLKNKIVVGENGEKFNIKEVNICFKLSELMELQEKLHKIEEKLSKIKNHPYQIAKNEQYKLAGDNREYFDSFLDLHCCEKQEKMSSLKKEEKNLNNKINELWEKSRKNTIKYFAGCVFISFETLKEQEEFLLKKTNNLIIYLLKLFGYVFCGCCINKNKKDLYWLRRKIRFERAPEPEDVVFENLEHTNSLSRIVRIFFVYFFSLILIFICFIIVTGFNYLRRNTTKNNDLNIIVAYIISLLISCCISGINLFFEKILDYLTTKEKNLTTTSFFLSKSIKLTLFSFMNEGIIPLISEIYMDTDRYEYLIINMLMIFLLNSVIIPISWTLSFSYLSKQFRIWLIERKVDSDNPDGNQEKTQKELNDLYELPSMELSEKYSYLFKTLLISFFYLQIFPLGVAISIFGLILGYFLEKFNFCNIYKRPEMLNDELCKVYVNYFILAIFVCGIGDYIFKNDVYETEIWSLVNIILFGCLIIIPYHYFINYLIKNNLGLNESEVHTNKLEEVYYKFYNDYERANPMTKKRGTINYLQALKERRIISEATYNKNIQNIDNANLMKLYYNERHKNIPLKTQKTIINKEKKNKSLLISSIKSRDIILDDDIDDLILSEDPTKANEQNKEIMIHQNKRNFKKENEGIEVSGNTSQRNIIIKDI